MEDKDVKIEIIDEDEEKAGKRGFELNDLYPGPYTPVEFLFGLLSLYGFFYVLYSSMKKMPYEKIIHGGIHSLVVVLLIPSILLVVSTIWEVGFDLLPYKPGEMGWKDLVTGFLRLVRYLLVVTAPMWLAILYLLFFAPFHDHYGGVHHLLRR